MYSRFGNSRFNKTLNHCFTCASMVNNKCDQKVTVSSDTADCKLYSSGNIKINLFAIALNSLARQHHSANRVKNLNW